MRGGLMGWGRAGQRPPFPFPWPRLRAAITSSAHFVPGVCEQRRRRTRRGEGGGGRRAGAARAPPLPPLLLLRSRGSAAACCLWQRQRKPRSRACVRAGVRGCAGRECVRVSKMARTAWVGRCRGGWATEKGGRALAGGAPATGGAPGARRGATALRLPPPCHRLRERCRVRGETPGPAGAPLRAPPGLLGLPSGLGGLGARRAEGNWVSEGRCGAAGAVFPSDPREILGAATPPSWVPAASPPPGGAGGLGGLRSLVSSPPPACSDSFHPAFVPSSSGAGAGAACARGSPGPRGRPHGAAAPAGAFPRASRRAAPRGLRAGLFEGSPAILTFPYWPPPPPPSPVPRLIIN